MEKLNHDMRGVVFVNDADPYYELRRSGDLCEKCGCIEGCEEYKSTPISSCERFTPIIGFVPPLGTITGRFNTFRLGFAWPTRVTIGSVVALKNNRANELFGSAVVMSVDSGTIEKMAAIHARDNHLLIGQKLNAMDASEKLQEVLRKCYGKLFYDSAKGATVIYLERVEETLDESG